MVEIDRREFMKLSAAAAAASACPSLLNAMELQLGGQAFHQIRTFHPRQRKPYVCTTCSYFDGGFTFAEEVEIAGFQENYLMRFVKSSAAAR